MKSQIQYRFPSGSVRHQSGISLVVVLILLVAISILGIAVLRSSAMQERMSANQRDRSLAFQAAETAMRYAQEDVLGAAAGAWDTNVPVAADCANSGICPPGSAPAWRVVPTANFNFSAAGLAAAPEFWIEYLGVGPARKGSCDQLPLPLDCSSPMYRINARSRANGRADVVMQSTVISRIPDPGT